MTRCVRVLENLGGESVRRADDDANQVVLGQQPFYHQPACLACGSNHQNGHRNNYRRLFPKLFLSGAHSPCFSALLVVFEEEAPWLIYGGVQPIASTP